jgi:hypothetical protein
LPKFDPERVGELRNAELPARFSNLQKLKAINPEAFFYWTQCKGEDEK